MMLTNRQGTMLLLVAVKSLTELTTSNLAWWITLTSKLIQRMVKMLMPLLD